MIYKFVENAKDISVIENSMAYKLYQRLEEVNGDLKALNDTEKGYLKTVFNELWHHDTYKTGKYKIMGYVIDFSKWLKTYWVSTKYSGIQEIKAFNKTMLRENATSKSHILKIVEIQEDSIWKRKL